MLVQDYHLALMAPVLADLRPDLATAHFTHTPFADPSVLRMLRPRWATSCWPPWPGSAPADSTPSGGRRPSGRGWPRPDSVPEPRPRSSPPSPPMPAGCAQSAAEPEVESALARIEEAVGGSDRQVIVRVDRMELSKNLLRGFWAFDELLERDPGLRERVVFVALAYPTRQGLPEYLAYQEEVETTVARLNERWSTPGWTPVVLEVEDDYPRSLAALTRYDVLLVNPVRDGLNLVAMEGPLVNARDGALALSREAGAFDRLSGGALEINPFDVTDTATVLARALALGPDERAARARALRGTRSWPDVRPTGWPTRWPPPADRRCRPVAPPTGRRRSRWPTPTSPARPTRPRGRPPKGRRRPPPRVPSRRPGRPPPPWPRRPPSPAGPARRRPAGPRGRRRRSRRRHIPRSAGGRRCPCRWPAAVAARRTGGPGWASSPARAASSVVRSTAHPPAPGARRQWTASAGPFTSTRTPAGASTRNRAAVSATTGSHGATRSSGRTVPSGSTDSIP